MNQATTGGQLKPIVGRLSDDLKRDHESGDFGRALEGYAERARDMEEEIKRLRTALLQCARQAEALKRPCGIDPESPQALRNGQYQAISTVAHIALGTITGPQPPSTHYAQETTNVRIR